MRNKENKMDPMSTRPNSCPVRSTNIPSNTSESPSLLERVMHATQNALKKIAQIFEKHPTLCTMGLICVISAIALITIHLVNPPLYQLALAICNLTAVAGMLFMQCTTCAVDVHQRIRDQRSQSHQDKNMN
jgi:hypothetical protein